MTLMNQDAKVLIDVQSYEKFGWVIVKDLISQIKLENIRKYLIEVMSEAFGNKVNKERLKEMTLDGVFNELRLNDSDTLEIIKLTKNSFPFYQILSDDCIVNTVKKLQKSKYIHCVHDIAQFRIDSFEVSPRLFDWHQDYPYNQTSLDAVTAWIPLTKIDKKLGPLQLIPGSQNTNVIVKYNYYKKKGLGDTNKMIKFEFDKNTLKQSITIPNMLPGDVLFFHCKLLHKSGNNLSPNKSRWICNPRYTNSLDNELVKRKWLSVNDRNLDKLIEKYILNGNKSNFN